MNKFSAIIFDWAGTLWDFKTRKEFPDSQDVLEYLHTKRYKLFLVSIAFSEGTARRTQRINKSALKKYFKKILISDHDKSALYEKLITAINLPRSKILIIDDDLQRGISYGNLHGHKTVWIKKGKHARSSPTKLSKKPTYTIHSISELKNILST